jgi:hypothetical protein
MSTDSGTVVVHDELDDGGLYADRHTVEVTQRDGSTVRIGLCLFGEFASEGRFRRIEETTLMLAGSEADRDLGSARGESRHRP